MKIELLNDPALASFLSGKSEITLDLLRHFLEAYAAIGRVELVPTKTMIAVSNGQRRIAWITQLGKNFIHVVFPFHHSYDDNLCFQKWGQVPGSRQFNHHFRMLHAEDVNAEVRRFMKLSWTGD